MQRGQRIALLVAALVVLVVGFVIAQSGGSDKKDSGVQAIVVEGGKPAGGVKTIQVGRGEQVKLKVTSDVADEIHVHGYDLMKDVPAGGSVSFDFKATIDGKFDIELEGRKEQIASLVVQP